MSIFDDIEGELENKSYRFIWKKYADYDPYGADCIFGNNGVHTTECNCGGTGILIHKKQIEFHENKATFRALVAGRGSGKALALDTPIPTPTGWTRMGEIEVGDVVFDETGSKTTVLATYDVDAKKAWRIKFSDGTHIDACEDHQWTTWTHQARKSYRRTMRNDDYPMDWPNWRGHDAWGNQTDIGPKTVTTSDIVDTLKHDGRESNHSIPVCGALQTDEADLPIDPYLLGYWLGDGVSKTRRISVGRMDIAETVINLGNHCEILRVDDDSNGNHLLVFDTPGHMSIGRDCNNGRFTKSTGFVRTIKELGLFDNKHIPDIYLRSSRSQRLALLQGLMDTDGHASVSDVEFTSTNEKLAYGFLELARSLGQKPVMGIGVATLYGREISKKYRILWTPTIPVFRLSRKLELTRKSGVAQQIRHRARYIVGAEEIGPGPMRCISVDSPNSLYLAGSGMVPTHNSKSGAAELVKYIVEHPGAKVMIVAPNYGMLHRAAFEYFAPALPPGLIKSSNMQRHEINLVTGGKVWLASAEHPDSLRGPTVSAIWIDEASYLTEETFDILMACLRQTGYPLKLWATSTPKGKNYLWRLWVDSPSKQEELKNDWWYIQFRTHDNPWYPKKMLRALEVKLGDTPWGRQELLGSFEAFAGQIYPYFSRDVHVKDFQAEYRAGRLKFKEIFYAVDWGFADPTVILVCGVGDDNKLYILEEMYKEGLSMPEVVAEAKNLVNKWGKGRFVCDSAGQTQIDTFNKANLPSHDAYKSIPEGITMVGGRLFYSKDESGQFIVPPRLFFDSSCKNTLGEIEVYHYKEKEDGDESKPEPAKGQKDHGLDACRYAVMEIEGGQQNWGLVKDRGVLDAINSRPSDASPTHYASIQNMPSAKDLWRVGRRRFRMF